jgi:hypothetical protein
VHTRVVQLAELGHSELEQWKSLADHAIEPNPFMDPRFLSPFGHPHANAAASRVLVVEDSGEFLAVMPFEVVDRRILKLPAKMVISTTAFLYDFTPHYFPLVDAARPVEAIEALLHGLREHSLPGFLDLASVPNNSPLADAFFAAAASTHTPVVERGELEFAYCRREEADESPAPESALSSEPRVARLKLDHLSTSTARKYGQRYRALERYTGGALTVSDRGDDPTAIEDFLELQAAGWKGRVERGGGALRVVGYDEWFAEVATAFRADNKLSVFSLASELGPVYMAVAFRTGARLFGSQDAYDEKFAQFSAGALGRLAQLEHSMTNTAERFLDPNLRPKYVQSTQLYPDRRVYSTLLFATHGAVSNGVVRSIPALRRARARLAH